jgi:hypothetical protein
MQKMMSPNTRIDAYPVAGLTPGVDGTGVTAAQLNAGVRLSQAVVSGYTLAAADSDTDTSKTIEDEGNVETPTNQNYAGSLQFFRDPVGVPATVFTTIFDLFETPYAEHWIVSRQGKKGAEPYAAGDIISMYRFKNDPTREIEGDDSGPMMIEVEFLPQGEIYSNVTVAA